jgi:hypothetical protein
MQTNQLTTSKTPEITLSIEESHPHGFFFLALPVHAATVDDRTTISIGEQRKDRDIGDPDPRSLATPR